MTPVFDATLYRNKPDLGLPRCYVPSASALWGPSDDRNLLPTRIGTTIPTALTALNIEHWSVPDRMADLIATLNLFRRRCPPIRAGYYSLCPRRDYWRAILSPDSTQYQQWQRENDALAPLARAVDLNFPSLYTFYPNPEGWVRYAKANIAEAKRYCKEVYAFLWPQYHPSSNLAGQYLDADYWRLQLDTVAGLADGIVIWGGHQQSWDDAALWWQATKDFLNSLQS
jgi:hypothetical protein